MTPRTISRRNLIITAISGAMAWLGGSVSSVAAHAGRIYSAVGYSEFIGLCSDLRCPMIIGEACLLALPASERTRSALARTILADLMLAKKDGRSSDVLARAIKNRSQADFREGRVVTLDGWILSLTETRVYALTAFLAEPRAPMA